jgi:hypothetical protein
MRAANSSWGRPAVCAARQLAVVALVLGAATAGQAGTLLVVSGAPAGGAGVTRSGLVSPGFQGARAAVASSDERAADGNAVVDVEADAFKLDCNSNGVPDGEDIAQGTSSDCNANGVPDDCEASAVPPAVIVGAVSRNLHGKRGGPGDIALNVCGRVENSDVTSEPRLGGVTELRIAFDMPPGEPGAHPILLEAQACPGGSQGSYQPYEETMPPVAYVRCNELVLEYWLPLANARTYRLTLGPELSSVRCQRLELRNLIGDVNSDGRVDHGDRRVVVSTWTEAGFSAESDINLDGGTNSGDRSVVIGAWTGTENCAP